MHITVNENFTAVLTDDAESPAKMLQFPAYDLSTQKAFTSTDEAEEQAESYIPRFEQLSVDYISPEIQAENAAAFELQNNSDNVRLDRNSKLAESDWMGMSDNSMTAEWVTYRQALRDITAHENFPVLEDSDWPVTPS
tara:strand:- start:88 stop:501 length:414 start_codon:yes stop_codon:yes gene_type:complete